MVPEEALETLPAMPGDGREVPGIGRNPTPERSESSSGQFVVYGQNWKLRGDFCLLAEEVKTEFLRLLALKDEWTFPVVIQVSEALGGVNEGDPVRSKVSPIEDTFRFHIRVEVGDELKPEQIREEVLNVLLYEFILRNRGRVGETRKRLTVPDWLKGGIAAAIAYRAEGGRRNSLFGAIFRSGRILSVPDVMRGRKPDSSSVGKAIYDASACALVLTLLAQPEGSVRLQRLVTDLLVFDGTDYALLKKYYPDLSDSNNSLEKWWALQIASLAEPGVLDIMTVAETEAALQQALLVRVIAESGEVPEKRKPLFSLGRSSGTSPEGTAPETRDLLTYELRDYAHFIRRDDREAVLEAVRLRLMGVGTRAFPLHRALIAQYDAILASLAKGRKRGVDEKLAELAAIRLDLLKMARDAEDYLHWYEATQENRQSGAFEEYQKFAEQLREDRAPRPDPISQYLDALEKEWR